MGATELRSEETSAASVLATLTMLGRRSGSPTSEGTAFRRIRYVDDELAAEATEVELSRRAWMPFALPAGTASAPKGLVEFEVRF